MEMGGGVVQGSAKGVEKRCNGGRDGNYTVYRPTTASPSLRRYEDLPSSCSFPIMEQRSSSMVTENGMWVVFCCEGKHAGLACSADIWWIINHPCLLSGKEVKFAHHFLLLLLGFSLCKGLVTKHVMCQWLVQVCSMGHPKTGEKCSLGILKHESCFLDDRYRCNEMFIDFLASFMYLLRRFYHKSQLFLQVSLQKDKCKSQ